jgi:hypothetical protein
MHRQTNNQQKKIVIDIQATTSGMGKQPPQAQASQVKDHIIKIPSGTTNTYRLSRLFEVEAHILLKRL